MRRAWKAAVGLSALASLACLVTYLMVMVIKKKQGRKEQREEKEEAWVFLVPWNRNGNKRYIEECYSHWYKSLHQLPSRRRSHYEPILPRRGTLLFPLHQKSRFHYCNSGRSLFRFLVRASIDSFFSLEKAKKESNQSSWCWNGHLCIGCILHLATSTLHHNYTVLFRFCPHRTHHDHMMDKLFFFFFYQWGQIH